MGNVRTQLAHRATLRRATTSQVQGSPVSTWGTVATNMPCLLVLDQFSGVEGQVLTATAKRQGVLYVLPDANLKRDDRFSMRGRQTGQFKVTAYGSTAPDRYGFAHHAEWRVSEV